MKQIIGIALLFALLGKGSITYSQSTVSSTETKEQHMKWQAEKMAAAFSAADFTTLAKYTYPVIVKAMGGAEAMSKMLTKQMAQWKEGGMSFQSVSIGETSPIVKAGAELHGLVEQNLVMKVPGGSVAKRSWLLAVSQDGGKNWFFLDTAPLSPEQTKALFPAFNKALVIPKKEEGVFTPDKQ